MNTITIERLIESSKDFTIERESDHISYHEFIKYFSDVKEITKHNLIIGINFTYAWMPTILKLRNKQFEENVEILNRVKRGEPIKISDFQSLKSLFNNSLVGTSKLLHFIAPEQYPIWDSRVFRYIYKKDANHNSINRVENYLQYKKECHILANNEAFEPVYSIMKSKIDSNITRLRAIELICFSKGKRAINNSL